LRLIEGAAGRFPLCDAVLFSVGETAAAMPFVGLPLTAPAVPIKVISL
jgi:hypothetical protein